MVVLRDFFHSLAISSALFLESLFAIGGEKWIWVTKMQVIERGENGRLEGNGRVRSTGGTVRLL